MAETTTNKKKAFSTYAYKLDLSLSIEDPDVTVAPLSLTPETGKDVKIGDTDSTVTLQGVKFTRKIYEPGLIEAEVDITPVPAVDEVNKLFMMRKAKLSIINTSPDATEDEKENAIALNYFVYMVNPQIVMNNGKPSMFVKLTIYSMDKLMTLDKYSQVYTARKLGDILDYESKTFGFKKVMFTTNNNYLRHLKYPISGQVKDLADNSMELKTSLEFIQPYLVQYNETFYDFIVRTANRCGEFLLFEDGILYLGLPVTEKVKSIPTYHSVTFQDYSKNPLDIKTYTRDSAKEGNGELKRLKINTGVIDKDGSGFPKDAFTDDGLKYNSELAQDEYIYPLYRLQWTNLRHETGFNKITDLPIAAAFSILKAEMQNIKTSIIGNVIDFGVALAVEWGKLVFFSGMALFTENGKKDLDHFRAIRNEKEQADSKRCVHFAPLDERGWTSLNYYTDVRRYEEEQQKKIICIDMGTSYVDVKLGETIQVEGLPGNYVVIEVRQISDQTWTRDYKKFDPSDTSSDYYYDRQSQVIYAIPTYKDKNGKEAAMPPVVPVDIVRKAGPQTAFVVDNNDPKHQGRVRIAYPWQSTKSAKRMDLMQAEEELALAKNAVVAAENKIKELQDLLKKLTSEKEAVSSLKGLSDDEKKKKIADLEEEIKELDQQIAGLTLPEEGEETTSLSTLEYVMRVTQQEKLKRLQLRKEVLETIKEMLEGKTVDVDAEVRKLENEIKQTTDELLTKAKEARNQAEQNLKDKQKEVDKQAEEWTGELKDMASPWIRVATPMATKGGGTYFKPQVGDEVLVNYDNDNIERPYVVGSLFSKNVPDPDEFLNCTATKSDLLKGATTMIMSPNGHHIAFNDPTEGSAFLTGIQPGVGMIASCVNTLAGIDWGKDCTGGIHIGDRFGVYELSMSSHERKITVSSPMGDVSIDAFSGITLTAPNGDVKIVGKNVSIEAGNNIEITAGNNIQYPVEGHPKKRYKVANGIKGAVVGVLGSGVAEGAKYIDLTFVRTMAEVFLRPIEGTGCIKSKRYLMLEAGKGKAHIPQERYALTEKNGIDAEQDFFNNLMDCVEAIKTRCDGFVLLYRTLWDDACEKRLAWLSVQELLKDDHQDDFNPMSSGWQADFEKDWEDIFKESDFADIIKDGSITVWAKEYNTPDEKKKKLTESANAFARAVYMINRSYNNFLHLFDTPVKNPEIPYMDKILKDCFEENKKLRSQAWVDAYVAGDKPKDGFIKVKIEHVKEDPFVSKMKGFKRYLAAAFIADVASDEHFAMPKPSGLAAVGAFMADPFGMWGGRGKYLKIHFEKKDLTEERMASPYHWQQFVGNMRKFDTWGGRAAADAIMTPIQTALQLNQELTNHSDKVYKNTWQQIKDRKVWDDRPDGLILLSDRKDLTRAFESGKWRSSRTENRGNWKYLSEYLLRFM